jgi:environmental stress-induced protein Ves
VITPLDPAHYRRTPWKNGGGTTVDIADDGDIWRFGRTPIVSAGAFSDYAGHDRVQVLVAGRGLVLVTPDGEIDVRQPLRPVRFAGETPIVSRLEAGPVEVVNLIGRRSAVNVSLQVLSPGDASQLGDGTHLVYCPNAGATLTIDRTEQSLAADHGLRIEGTGPTMLACKNGVLLVGSVTCVSRS